jgi:hypothetical protein
LDTWPGASQLAGRTLAAADSWFAMQHGNKQKMWISLREMVVSWHIKLKTLNLENTHFFS